MKTRIMIAALMTASLPWLTIGCGEDGESSRAVVVDGSSTVFRISQKAVEEYQKEKPEVNVVVHNHGTGGGFGKYAQGEVDIIDASRPAKPEEEKKAIEGKMAWTRYLVGYDGITVVVNPKNEFVKSLTVDQLKRLFEPQSTVKTWKDLDASWPDRPISLFSPDRDSGTFEFFTEAITGKAKAQRNGVQQSPDDNVLVGGVSGDVDALGYFGYAYYAANSANLKAVPIQAGADATPVMPSPATILDKSYKPLARPLFLYVKNASMARPEVAGFVKFYLDHIEALSTAAGYVAPTAEDREVNQKSLGSVSSSSATVATGG